MMSVVWVEEREILIEFAKAATIQLRCGSETCAVHRVQMLYIFSIGLIV